MSYRSHGNFSWDLCRLAPSCPAPQSAEQPAGGSGTEATATGRLVGSSLHPTPPAGPGPFHPLPVTPEPWGPNKVTLPGVSRSPPGPALVLWTQKFTPLWAFERDPRRKPCERISQHVSETKAVPHTCLSKMIHQVPHSFNKL